MKSESARRRRLVYLSIFLALVAVEVLIALFVHDRFVRPYVGDVIVVAVVYCFVRTFVPTGVKWLPLAVFLFATVVEVGQYFDYVNLLGLGGSTFFRTLLGTSFSFVDILCYGVGTVLCLLAECLAGNGKDGVK